MNQRRWPIQLAVYPYALPLLTEWQTADHSRDLYWPEYEQALEAYLHSQDESKPLGDRYGWLTRSRDQFRALAEKGDAHIGTNLALIRVNLELDDRLAAMDAMEAMLELMPWFRDPLPDSLQLHINRPFLAPIALFDQQVVVGTLGQWLQSSILAALHSLSQDA